MRPLLLLLLLAAPLPASVVRPGPVRLPDAAVRHAVIPPAPELEEGEFLITPATAVWLDGRRVKIEAIPDGCEVTEIVVNHRREVLVVKFKSPAKGAK